MHGQPLKPTPFFTSTRSFPIENRPDHPSGAVALKSHLKGLLDGAETTQLADALSNFHVLLALAEMDVIRPEASRMNHVHEIQLTLMSYIDYRIVRYCMNILNIQQAMELDSLKRQLAGKT
jgi:hypothetical protein